MIISMPSALHTQMQHVEKVSHCRAAKAQPFAEILKSSLPLVDTPD